MVKFIWLHNVLKWGLMALSKCPLEGWTFGSQTAKNETPPCSSKTKSQRSEPNWLLKYFITPNFCAKFQPNRLTTTFGPWNTFSDNDAFKVLRDRPPPSLFDRIIGGPT